MSAVKDIPRAPLKNENLWFLKGLENSPGAGAALVSEQLRAGEIMVLVALNGLTEGRTL